MSDYQKDFYSWTCEQAELLRAGRFNELEESIFPVKCPWTLDQIRDDGYFPD